MRYDEIDWFDRISDGHVVLWMASASQASYLWHATADGVIAVCSSRIKIDRHRNPYPTDTDRSQSVMTCTRCQELVRRTPMPAPASCGPSNTSS